MAIFLGLQRTHFHLWALLDRINVQTREDSSEGFSEREEVAESSLAIKLQPIGVENQRIDMKSRGVFLLGLSEGEFLHPSVLKGGKSASWLSLERDGLLSFPNKFIELIHDHYSEFN